MQIAEFSDTYKPQVNGVVSSIINTNVELMKRRNSPILFAPASAEGMNTADGFPVYTFSSLSFPLYPEYLIGLPSLDRVVSICRRHKTRIIHTHTPFPLGLAALHAQRALNVPCVGTFHTMIPDYLSYISGNPLYDKFLSLLEHPSWYYIKTYYGNCDAVTCPSSSTALALRKHGIKSEVIPNGVDTERFNPSVSGASFRRKFNISSSEKVILYVGRLSHEKNLSQLLEAARQIDARVVFVGRGPALPALKALARKKGVTKKIIFTGYLPDKILPSCYAGCDVFAFPSKTETQGMAPLEAMAIGKPVVVFAGAAAEAVAHGKSGYVAKTEAGFLEFVDILVQEKEKRKKFGETARKLAMSYSRDVCIRKLLGLYRRLA